MSAQIIQALFAHTSYFNLLSSLPVGKETWLWDLSSNTRMDWFQAVIQALVFE